MVGPVAAVEVAVEAATVEEAVAAHGEEAVDEELEAEEAVQGVLLDP